MGKALVIVESPAKAKTIGSILGAETVQHLGAAIPSVQWPRIRAQAGALITS